MPFPVSDWSGAILWSRSWHWLLVGLGLGLGLMPTSGWCGDWLGSGPSECSPCSTCAGSMSHSPGSHYAGSMSEGWLPLSSFPESELQLQSCVSLVASWVDTEGKEFWGSDWGPRELLYNVHSISLLLLFTKMWLNLNRLLPGTGLLQCSNNATICSFFMSLGSSSCTTFSMVLGIMAAGR